MRFVILRYIYQYLFATLIFFIAFVMERMLLLHGLTLWLLAYFLIRRVSFKTVFMLGILADLLSVRIVGVTGIYLSLILIVTQLLPKWRGVKIWAICGLGIAVFRLLEVGTLGLGYISTSLLFLLIFFFLIPAKQLIFNKGWERQA